MIEKNALAKAIAVNSLLMLGLGSAVAHAQQEPQSRGTTAAMLEEVIITARKREEAAQEVPLSVSAFNGDQLEALKIRDLTNLSVGMPNVVLDDVGTVRGFANFSIRGLGINSSIPSIDPTVGVFVNGVYLGLSRGVIFDMFDLSSVEVLRGPQGTLFGRNVTAGAVLISTKKPGDELEGTVMAASDTGKDGGLNNYIKGAIGGPLTDTLGARAVVYYNHDDGPFENEFTGDDFGKVEQTMARGTLVWAPTDNTELVTRYEYGDIDGDGAAGQNHINGSGVEGNFASFDRDGFKFSIDEEGFQKETTKFLTTELNQGVDFGDGNITAIYGWRKYDSHTFSDIDSQPVWLFHGGSWLEAEQNSLELRYSGLFGERTSVTVGGFYFDNDMTFHERRELLGIATGNVSPALQLDGGGDYEVESYTAFATVDYDLTDKWTLTAGVNYSIEEKDVKIASLSQNQNSPCNLVTNSPAPCEYDFTDDEDWDNVAPKLGATYNIDDQRRVYGHWTRGYRSGGYNLRNTSFDPADTPGPFDEEEVNNYEIGYKSDNSWGRLNAAFFYNEIDDLQRELNFPNQGAGTVQLVRNTADATIYGVEVDATISLTETLLLLTSVGYIDAEYDSVKADLNGDGVVDGKDEALDLPRAPEWTYSVGLNHDLDLGEWGYISSRINYAYRDETAFTDSNLGYIDEQKILDAGVDFHAGDGHWIFSIYGRNLLDEVKFGGDTQLPDTIGPIATGGTFAPLMRGARYGVEVTYNFF